MAVSADVGVFTRHPAVKASDRPVKQPVAIMAPVHPGQAHMDPDPPRELPLPFQTRTEFPVCPLPLLQCRCATASALIHVYLSINPRGPR